MQVIVVQSVLVCEKDEEERFIDEELQNCALNLNEALYLSCSVETLTIVHNDNLQ